MKSTDRKVVCVIEDDIPRIENIQEFYDRDHYAESFDLRFLFCEQHFWDQFGLEKNKQTALDTPYRIERALAYERERDGYPNLIVLDMMLEWNTVLYESDRPYNGGKIDLAGERIAEFLVENAEQLGSPEWWIWTAIDCTGLRAPLMKNLNYKDALPASDLLQKIKTEFEPSGSRGKRARKN